MVKAVPASVTSMPSTMRAVICSCRKIAPQSTPNTGMTKVTQVSAVALMLAISR